MKEGGRDDTALQHCNIIEINFGQMEGYGRRCMWLRMIQKQMDQISPSKADERTGKCHVVKSNKINKSNPSNHNHQLGQPPKLYREI